MIALDLDDVDPPRRAAVAEDHIVASKQAWARSNRRPGALTAREAMASLQFEALFTWCVASSIRNGVQLTDADFARLTLAMQRIDVIALECCNAPRP